MTLADTSTARMTHLILQCHQNATKATASQFSNSTPPRLLRIATTSGVESLDRLCLGALSLERLWRDPNCPKSENLQSVEFPATKKLFGCLHPSSTLLPRLCCTPWLDVNDQKTMHVEERLLKLWHMLNQTRCNLGSWIIQEMLLVFLQKIFVWKAFWLSSFRPCFVCRLPHPQCQCTDTAEICSPWHDLQCNGSQRFPHAPWGHRTGGVRKWGSKASTGFWSNVLRGIFRESGKII